MADNAVPVAAPEGAELSTEQQLEALFAEKDPTAQAAVPGESSSPPPDSTSSPASEIKPDKVEVGETPPVAEPTLDEKLALLEEPAPKDEKPALTTEQQQILAAIPDPQTLTQIQSSLQTFSDFNNAFASHNFKAVQGMFEQGNPEGWAAFLDYIYQTQVAADTEKGWLARWVTEQESGKGVTAAQRALETKLSALQNQVSAREQAEQTARQNQQRLDAKAKYDSYLDGLFDKIEYNKADRKWVTAEIFNRVVGDSKTRAAINQGNLAAVIPVFKAAVKEYSERDKEAKESISVKLKAQEQKKVLPGAGGSALETGSEDMTTAKPEERDNVMLRQLNRLFGTK